VKFHCVEVVAGTHACAAAKALKDVRLLSAEAPKLPLATCEHPLDCDCTYEHFSDRRHGARRSDEHVARAIAYTVTERRIGHGRRVVDDI
jgi:hypothetical protein